MPPNNDPPPWAVMLVAILLVIIFGILAVLLVLRVVPPANVALLKPMVTGLLAVIGLIAAALYHTQATDAAERRAVHMMTLARGAPAPAEPEAAKAARKA